MRWRKHLRDLWQNVELSANGIGRAKEAEGRQADCPLKLVEGKEVEP
jgi:hypothetical protein